MDGVNITDEAFGGIGTFSRDGRYDDIPVVKAEDHEVGFRSVYVNAIGHSTFISEKVAGFPEGSVIVRERLSESNSLSPESLVVMVKRGKGFNPTGGDWEYMALNGAGTTIRERGQMASCQSCHAKQKETDFVFRTYLPKQIQFDQR